MKPPPQWRNNAMTTVIPIDAALQESTMDKEQALKWAVAQYRDTGRWPVRRFRVEGTACGNSKLLTEAAAQEAKAKFGGEIVCMMPGKKWVPASALAESSDG